MSIEQKSKLPTRPPPSEGRTAKRHVCAVLALSLAAGGALAAEIDTALEAGLGNFIDLRQVERSLLVLDEGLDVEVDAMVNRLAGSCPRGDLDYNVRILVDPVINAYAAPGGAIYLTSGLLDILDSRAELAAVLAHEVVHVCNSHSIKDMRSSNRKRQTGYWAGVILGTIGGAYAGDSVGGQYRYQYSQQLADAGRLFGGVLGERMGRMAARGYSKRLEIEADELGVDYAHRAGYDPHGFVGLFKKLIRFRNDLEPNARDDYASALVHKAPGLEARLELVEARSTRLEGGQEVGNVENRR